MSGEIPEGSETSEEQGSNQEGSSSNSTSEDYLNLGNSEEQSSSEEEKSGGNNPAWNPLLEKLPEEFHKIIEPDLKSWDENFSKVQSRYAPYKEIVEKEIPMESINQSLELSKILASDPKSVWEELGRRYGFGGEQGQGEEGTEEEDEEEDDDSYDLNEGEKSYDLEKDPRFLQQQEQLQQMQQYLEEQAQKEQDFQLEQQIEQEFQALEKDHGKFDRDEVIRRAIFIADRTGEEPDLQKGYEDYSNFVSKVRNERANNSAPDVMSGNGNLPVQKPNMASMTQDERIQFIANRAEALNQKD